MIPIDYKGKVVLVTGGGRGIGLAITEAFAEGGATLIITYQSRDPSPIAAQLSQKYGVPVHVYHCPGENSKIVDEVVEKASKEVGEIDVVVCNAGVSMWKALIDCSDDDLNSVFSVNLVAPIYLARALTRHWLKLPTAVPANSPTHPDKGLRDQKVDLNKRILMISSISGLVNMTPQQQVAYNASKAGLTMAAKTLAGEWAQYGISINCISPGYVATEMTTSHTDERSLAYARRWQEMTPFDRFASPAEIANLAVLLCSTRNTPWMTGSDVVIDGGYTTY